MAIGNSKKYFWTVLGSGISIIATGLFSFFHYFNNAHFVKSFQEKQNTHIEFQKRIKNNIAVFKEKELLASLRNNSTFSYHSSFPQIYELKNKDEQLIFNERTSSLDKLRTGLKKEDVAEQNEGLDRIKNRRVKKTLLVNSNGLNFSMDSPFDYNLRNKDSYPDPVKRKLEYILGVQTGVDFYSTRTDFSSELMKQNVDFSSKFIDGDLKSRISSIHQSYSFGIFGGIIIKDIIEIQTGIVSRSTRGSSTVISENRYEKEYTFVEGIVIDNGDIVVEQSITQTREEIKVDTLYNKYTLHSTEIPLNIRVRKEFKGITAFLSAGVSIAVYNRGSFETHSSLFGHQNTISTKGNGSRNSYQLGVGLDYKILQKINLRVEPTYRYTSSNSNFIGGAKPSSVLGINAGVYLRF